MDANIIAHRLIQVCLLVFSAFMILGGGFFWQQGLADNFTKTTTYTLYTTLPPPPEGPSFCKVVTIEKYGLVMPCDFQPPFVWWLRH